MECIYELCIYQSNDRCGLDHISIDELGMCRSAVNLRKIKPVRGSRIK